MRLLLGLVPALLWTATAQAGGFEVAQQSAAAGGSGHAGAARSDDPECAWYNPAALADGRGLRLSLGVALAFPQIHAEATDGSWTSDTESGVSTPPHLYASYAEDEWALGLSLNVAFGGGVRWPANWDGRFEILESRPQLFRIAPFFAWSFARLRVAAGVHVDAGSLEIRRGLDFVDTEGDVHILMGAWGLGLDLSAFYQASEALDLGLTYRSRTHLWMSGDADFTVPDAFLTRAPDQGVSAEWTLPDRLVLGVVGRLGDVRLLGDLALNVWSVNDALVLDFESENTPDTVIRNDWSATVSVRAGAEWRPDPRFVVRAGGYWDPTPVPAETLSPSSPDSDRIGLTVGGGVTLGEFSVDAFYEYLHLTERESTSQDAPLARYSGHAHVVGIGVAYRSGVPEPAHDVGQESGDR